MATIEELLGLSKEGWQQISQMNEDELQIYLKDITNLERTSRIVNVSKKELTDEELLSKVTSEIGEKEDNPFTKAKKKNKKVKTKLLSTYDMDLEAKSLEQELNEL